MPSAARASLSPISWVAIDLTLTSRSAPAAGGELGDDPAGLVGVAGPVHGRAGRGGVASNSTSSSGRRRRTSALIAAPASRSCSQSSSSATTRSRLSRMVWVACRRLARSCGCRSSTWAARGNGTPPSSGSGGVSHGPAPPRSASPSCRVRRRDRPPPMCVRHELSTATTVSAPVDVIAAHLSASIAPETSGVLQRERATETTALLGARQLDQVDVAQRRATGAAACRPGAAAAARGRSGGRSPGAGSGPRRRSRRARRRAVRRARRCGRPRARRRAPAAGTGRGSSPRTIRSGTRSRRSRRTCAGSASISGSASRA